MTALLRSPRSLILPRGTRKPARPVLDPTHPLSRGLVGCWLLGDVGEDIAVDLSGQGHDGHQIGIPLTMQSSHHGGLASQFSSVASYYSLGANAAPLQSAAGTICAWVYANNWSVGATFPGIISRGGSTFPPYGNYQLNLAGSGANYFGGSFNVAGTWTSVNNGNNYALTTWYFLVMLYDGANISLYVNTVLDGQTAATGALQSFSVSAVNIGNNTSFTANFDGRIEGVRVYDNRALTPAEIRSLYTEPYAGIYEAQSFSRVGIAASSFQPAWAVRNNQIYGGYAS